MLRSIKSISLPRNPSARSLCDPRVIESKPLVLQWHGLPVSFFSYTSHSGLSEDSYKRIKDIQNELKDNNISDLHISESEFHSAAKEFLYDFRRKNIKELAVEDINDMEKISDKMISSVFLNFLSDKVHKLKDARYERQSTAVVEKGPSILHLTDLRYPALWFPLARTMKRRIICHVGPTNSGKTHAAINVFKAASSGIYCAPLRLLAMEMYERLNSGGIRCSLLTGEAIKGPKFDEKKVADSVDDMAAMFGYSSNNSGIGSNDDPLENPAVRQVRSLAPFSACTVEMADFKTMVDVAIIDEIQMMSDRDRGWAFAHALLGLPAKEIHLCGESSAVYLIKQICSQTGDEVEVIHYERLAPLTLAQSSLNNSFDSLRKGDCVVCFSRKAIFKMKRLVELSTGKKCAVVYGSLPMESRTHQAKLFNDPESDFEILVATDAIGMGLNLNIRRIVFQSTMKFDGRSLINVPYQHVKQIGGRAGRFNSAFGSGEVTALLDKDLLKIKKAFNAPNRDYTQAGIFPLLNQVLAIAEKYPGLTFEEILIKFEEIGRCDASYFLCNLDTLKVLAGRLASLPLSLRDKYNFVCAPVNPDDDRMLNAYVWYATKFSKGEKCPVRISARKDDTNSESTLFKYESIHRTLILYMWLSIRYPKIFTEFREAAATALELESIILDSLMELSEEAVKESTRSNALDEVFQKMPKRWMASESDGTDVANIKNTIIKG